jgi:hypothetical protein
MIWSPICSKRFMISSRFVSAAFVILVTFPLLRPLSSGASGAIPQAPTIHAARPVALWTSPPTPVEFWP